MRAPRLPAGPLFLPPMKKSWELLKLDGILLTRWLEVHDGRPSDAVREGLELMAASKACRPDDMALLWVHAVEHEVWNDCVDPDLRTQDSFYDSLDGVAAKNLAITRPLKYGLERFCRLHSSFSVINKAWTSDWYDMALGRRLVPVSISGPVLSEIVKMCHHISMLPAFGLWKSVIKKRLQSADRPKHADDDFLVARDVDELRKLYGDGMNLPSGSALHRPSHPPHRDAASSPTRTPGSEVQSVGKGSPSPESSNPEARLGRTDHVSTTALQPTASLSKRRSGSDVDMRKSKSPCPEPPTAEQATSSSHDTPVRSTVQARITLRASDAVDYVPLNRQQSSSPDTESGSSISGLPDEPRDGEQSLFMSLSPPGVPSDPGSPWETFERCMERLAEMDVESDSDYAMTRGVDPPPGQLLHYWSGISAVSLGPCNTLVRTQMFRERWDDLEDVFEGDQKPNDETLWTLAFSNNVQPESPETDTVNRPPTAGDMVLAMIGKADMPTFHAVERLLRQKMHRVTSEGNRVTLLETWFMTVLPYAGCENLREVFAAIQDYRRQLDSPYWSHGCACAGDPIKHVGHLRNNAVAAYNYFRALHVVELVSNEMEYPPVTLKCMGGGDDERADEIRETQEIEDDDKTTIDEARKLHVGT